MQSPGPPYRGSSVVSTDLYLNRNYENRLLSSDGVSNSYLTYHSDGSHPSNYSDQSHNHYSTSSPTSQSPHGSHSSHPQYNSSNSGQSYGPPVNQFNEMYGTCSPYAAIPSAIRQPISSTDIKYWNSDQMSHNSHNNYNQGIPPPPLVSRTPDLGSPTHRSPHNSTYRSSSQSPQEWSRQSNVMHSPSTTSTTPSPLPSHSAQTRSPSHVSSQQFSPSHTSHSGLNDQSVQKGQQMTASVYNNQNHNSSHVNASNPLQSLQKMVMIESDGADGRSAYDGMAPTPLQNNGTVPLNTNTTQKNYNNDQNLNNDPESPYPTYYNLDQNRLCTPPHPNPNTNQSYPNIPERTDGQLGECDNELKKSETNCNDSNNDLIYSNLDESKPDVSHKSNSKVSQKINDSLSVVNGENDEKKVDDSMANSDASSSNLSEQPSVPAICKRTASQDSIQSSDSETAHSAYAETRAQHNWQTDKEYMNRHSDHKNTWSQWPTNGSQQPLSAPRNNYIPECRPVPSLTHVPKPIPYQSSYGITQCGSGSWTQSATSSQSSSNMNRDFASPNNISENSSKKRRGRPAGSKNRRNSDDTNSETNTSEQMASNRMKKKKKSSTEEIGINTSVSVDAHGFDELAVVNPLRPLSKRKKTVGPFIRLEKGKGRAPTLFTIVNASTKPEDEKDVKTKLTSVKTEPIKHMRRPSLLVNSKKFVSTLSPHYDMNNRDKTWICALCHKGPHYKGLGDLYGPYSISADDKNKNQTSASTSSTATTTATTASIKATIDSVVASTDKRIRRRKSETSEDTPKGKPKQTSKTFSEEPNHSTNQTTEVWVHEDCIVWSNGVYLVGHRVRNLEEIISESSESLCTKCKLSGATLGCLQKSCNTSQLHYLCAKEKGCELNDENFSIYCSKHKKKTKISSDVQTNHPFVET